MQLALDQLLPVEPHVVAQVVEPELVVGAVRDVGRVGLLPGAWPEVDQPFVGRRITGLEDVRRVVRDHPDGQPEQVVDRAHPLTVAPGQVVVHGHDVNAAPGERVEGRGKRRHERLALARPHLGDLALV